MSATASERRARTKIVATVGPASQSGEMLVDLIQHGVDVFRVNTAHGERSQHEAIVAGIRQAAEQCGRPIGILVDLSGPKIRLGALFQDPTELHSGQSIDVVRGEQPTAPNTLVSNYEPLVDEVNVGDHIMLADGTICLEVREKFVDRASCNVVEGGILRSRQGINLPGVRLSVPAITSADRQNAEWAADVGIDFISLSFVRSPKEIEELIELVQSRGSRARVIAKIEKAEAMECLEDIVAAADGVMVARGDLGVEIDLAEIAVAQKRIIATCQRLCKPVIVATQMLDSMQHSRRPTRAEATDVANAIFDGADACMLSGETAIGEFPRETVDTMNRIMVASERLLHDSPSQPPTPAAIAGVHPVTAAVSYGAAQIAAQLFARLVVVVTQSGATARVKAKQRDFIETVCISNDLTTLRQMTLLWGITPLAHAPVDGRALRQFVSDWGKRDGCLTTGDRVVCVMGTNVSDVAHNQVVVFEVL